MSTPTSLDGVLAAAAGPSARALAPSKRLPDATILRRLAEEP